MLRDRTRQAHNICFLCTWFFSLWRSTLLDVLSTSILKNVSVYIDTKYHYRYQAGNQLSFLLSINLTFSLINQLFVSECFQLKNKSNHVAPTNLCACSPHFWTYLIGLFCKIYMINSSIVTVCLLPVTMRSAVARPTASTMSSAWRGIWVNSHVWSNASVSPGTWTHQREDWMLCCKLLSARCVYAVQIQVQILDAGKRESSQNVSKYNVFSQFSFYVSWMHWDKQTISPKSTCVWKMPLFW